MKLWLRKSLFCLTVSFYIPLCLSVPTVSLGAWFAGGHDNADSPVCGCDDAGCCCGAACCAEVPEAVSEQSCCDSSEVDSHVVEKTPASPKATWQASCTCGKKHGADGTILVDPHTIAHGSAPASWYLAWPRNSASELDLISRQLTPPEQVPKSFLYC